jgi:pantetheine-phosphate adenylyltransferase
VFLTPSQEYTYLNSTLVKEVARFGGRVRGLVTPLVERRLREKLGAARTPARRARPARRTAKGKRR